MSIRFEMYRTTDNGLWVRATGVCSGLLCEESQAEHEADPAMFAPRCETIQRQLRLSEEECLRPDGTPLFYEDLARYGVMHVLALQSDLASRIAH